jgi:4-aminobutyrate aminotransferase-like enzyme
MKSAGSTPDGMPPSRSLSFSRRLRHDGTSQSRRRHQVARRLRENAERMGAILLEGLRDLATQHPILGDLRGRSLFLGFEMVRDRESLEPAAEEATYLVNRMKVDGVLNSTDGPLENVIKLKLPRVFSEGDAALFLDKLAMVLLEDALKV